MQSKPVILVTGATGAQGGSVVRALLAGGKYTVRAMTRNASSEKARALSREGAIVVEGDLGDPESLGPALQGCYGVFGITNFWEHFVHEYRHGKNLADAVAGAGVRHFIYSSLPSYHQLSDGKFPVPHCDGKAAVSEYIKSLGLPYSFVHMPFYYENFLSFFPPQKADDGAWHFGFPQGDTQLAMASVEDLGGIVALMFDHRDMYLGRTVGVVGEDRRCSEYAAIMSKVLGVTVRYDYIPRDIYADLGFPGAEELANMFEVQRLHIRQRWSDQMEAYHMYVGMQPFETWLERNRAKFSMAYPGGQESSSASEVPAGASDTGSMRSSILSWVILILTGLLLGAAACNGTAERSGDARKQASPDSVQLVKRGEYLVSAIGCDDCHSPKKMGPHGPELDLPRRFSGYPAGLQLAPFDTLTSKRYALFSADLTACIGPWGVSFAANITSDATGIGNWTEAQFIRCMREGKWMGLEGGRQLLPPMPWQNFGKLSNDDLRSIYAYLKTTKAVDNRVPDPLPPGVTTIAVKQDKGVTKN